MLESLGNFCHAQFGSGVWIPRDAKRGVPDGSVEETWIKGFPFQAGQPPSQCAEPHATSCQHGKDGHESLLGFSRKKMMVPKPSLTNTGGPGGSSPGVLRELLTVGRVCSGFCPT